MTSLIPSTQSQLMTYTYKKQDQYIQSADTVCRQINIADIIDNHPDLTMFKHVLAKSNMTDMFKHTYYNKKYTLFVPNNNSLSHDKMNQLTRIDTADAIHIVNSSTIEHQIPRSLIENSRYTRYKTRNLHNNLYVSHLNGNIHINGVVNIIQSDIITSNGIIHIIDDLIYPGKYY